MAKWTNTDAGPKQVKDFNRAVSKLRSEGQTHDELSGVIGGKEHRSSLMTMFGACRPEVTALDEAIGQKYGYQVTRTNVREIIAAYEAALPEARTSRPIEDNRRSPEQDAELTAVRDAQAAEYQAKRAAESAVLAQVMAKAPASAKGIIVAELHKDASDPMTDYFASHSVRTVAIGWRFSAREDFRALHAAAAQFPETKDTEFTEHRDNYSMGAGNYLSDHGGAHSGSGWVIKSRTFPCTYLSLTEDAIPAQPAQPTSPAASTAPAQGTNGSKPVKATEISPNVLDILSRATADGNTVRIKDRLNRADYVAVNEVLAAAGGKWNRKAQAHLFPEDAAPILAALQDAGSIVRPQDEGYFTTPAAVVADMIALAGLKPGMEVLEPSAGTGNIAKPVAEFGCAVDCIEMNAKRAGIIYAEGYARSVTMADFLAVPQRPAYDRVIMNPPFAGKADIAHVRHALGFLRPGGILVSVMAAGVQFREDRTTAKFRELVYLFRWRDHRTA